MIFDKSNFVVTDFHATFQPFGYPKSHDRILKALFHSSQKLNSQARCENFHPIIIFESTRCKLCEVAFAISGKEALRRHVLGITQNKMFNFLSFEIKTQFPASHGFIIRRHEITITTGLISQNTIQNTKTYLRIYSLLRLKKIGWFHTMNCACFFLCPKQTFSYFSFNFHPNLTKILSICP